MGYITTISIYNDGAYQLKANPEQLAEVLTNACQGVYNNSHRLKGSASLGNHANLFTVQKPRHADDKTIYVHAGNTVVEMSAYSDRCKDILERVPDFFDQLLSTMEDRVKEMQQMKKDFENGRK